jgi:Tfp pilus assembly protein PilF
MGAMVRNTFAVFALTLATALAFSQSADDRQASLASHLQKAQEYLSQKRPDLAIPELQAAVAIDPENVETQGNLGVLLYFHGKPAEAIPHLRAAVERQPGLGKIQGLLGLAEEHTLDAAQGRKDLEAAFPLIPDAKFKIEVGLELVGICTRSEDFDEAVAVLSQLRKAAPDNPEVLYATYRTYSELSGEAMLALSLAAPDSAQMHQLLAHEEARQGKNDAAAVEFRKAIAIDPHLPGVHFELAELLSNSRDPALKKQAEEEYRTALAENPQDEKSTLRLAEIDAGKGNPQRSVEEYNRAVALQPSDADAKLGLAKALIGMNQTDQALQLLEAAVQLEPTNATAHYRLSTVYRKLGRVDESKREVELYKKCKDMKDRLRALYKDLEVQPKELRADDRDQN